MQRIHSNKSVQPRSLLYQGFSLSSRMLDFKKIIGLFGFLLISTSCVYRFTNLHLRAPEGVRNIAIEGVYDTSQNVVPHEYLWESLQKQFVIDGRLRLSSQDEADIYLRAQLSEAIQSPGVATSRKIDNPSSFSSGANNPHPLSAYSNFKTAYSHAKSENLKLEVKIEIWNLKSNLKIFQKTYTSSSSYIVHDEAIPSESSFLYKKEGLDNLFLVKSDEIAKQVVRDFLSL